MGREHGHLCFHLTQILTGHDCFAAFLHGIGKETTDACHHCDGGSDTAQHTFQDCPVWGEQRTLLRSAVGTDLTLATVVGKMLESEEGWRATAQFAMVVMTAKEQAERDRERGE